MKKLFIMIPLMVMLTACSQTEESPTKDQEDIVTLEAYVELGREIKDLEDVLEEMSEKYEAENKALKDQNAGLLDELNQLATQLEQLSNQDSLYQDLSNLTYEVNDLRNTVGLLEADLSLALDQNLIELEQEVVVVDTAQGLLEAIGPNKKIILEEGSYNLSQVNYFNIDNPHLSVRDVYDGYEFVLKHVRNLEIVGSGARGSSIVVEPRYAFIFNFENGRDITFDNLYIGHTIEKGACVGGVLQFENCKDVLIEDSLLYGCGTYGLVMNGMKNFEFLDSVIEECSYGIMQIYNSSNILFNGSIFRDNEEYDMVTVSLSKDVTFDNCTFENNYSSYDSFFIMYGTENFALLNSVFKNNEAPAIMTPGYRFKMVETNFYSNNFTVNDLIYYD